MIIFLENRSEKFLESNLQPGISGGPALGPADSSMENNESANNSEESANNSEESANNNEESANNNEESANNNEESANNNEESANNNEALTPSKSEVLSPSKSEVLSPSKSEELLSIERNSSMNVNEKFHLVEFNTMELQNNINESLNKILGMNISNDITFTESEYYFTIKVDKENMNSFIFSKNKREEIIKSMTEIFHQHLRKLYLQNSNEKYNVTKDRIKVLVMKGSLVIVLEILSKAYEKAPTIEEENEMNDLEEYRKFMSTFNSPGGTGNIIQYEPEGVSGIFAPYIKIA